MKRDKPSHYRMPALMRQYDEYSKVYGKENAAWRVVYKECLRCGMKNDFWRYCGLESVVSFIRKLSREAKSNHV